MVLKIEGQRFGRLVAVKPLRTEKRKRIWLFKCDCGNTAELPATFVVRLHTQSCGCYRVEQLRDAVSIDVDGQRFGRLTVLGRVGSSGGRVAWRCLCDCGREVVRPSKNLRNGTATSCGCRKEEARQENVKAREVDLVGQRFGKLVVSSLAAGQGEKRWVCECDCGGERVSRHGDLQSGRVISCGCAAKEKTSYMPVDARLKGAVHCASRRARAKAAGGTFTKEQIDELLQKQRGRCAWCHTRLDSSNLARDHRTALANGGSNDIRNIELLCADCNGRKSAKDEIAWANECGRLL